MIYTAKDIPLKRAIKVLDLNMINYLKVIRWVPVPGMKKRLESFKKEFNELFNYDQISKALKDEIHLLILLNKIENILPCLYLGLTLMPKQPEFKEYFKHLYGFWPKANKDYQRVLDDKKRLTDKYNVAAKMHEKRINESKDDSKGYELAKLVTWTQDMTSYIDRNITLYEFRNEYNKAIEKVKNLKKR